MKVIIEKEIEIDDSVWGVQALIRYMKSDGASQGDIDTAILELVQEDTTEILDGSEWSVSYRYEEVVMYFLNRD